MGGRRMKKRYVLIIIFICFLSFFVFSAYLYKKNYDTVVLKISEFLQKQSNKLPLVISEPSDLSFNPLKRIVSLKTIYVSPKKKKEMKRDDKIQNKPISFNTFKIKSLDFHFSVQDVIYFTLSRKFRFSEVTAHIDELNISFEDLEVLSQLEKIKAKNISSFFNLNFPRSELKTPSQKYEISFKKIIPVQINFDIKNLSFLSKSLDIKTKKLFISSKIHSTVAFLN